MLLLSWIGGAVWLDRYGAVQQKPKKGTCDAIVVAGCKVAADGTPGVALRRRVTLAVELWRERVADRVFFTGGSRRRCSSQSQPHPSEARSAAAYAERIGLPPECIAFEERSTSTVDNARFALSALGPARVVVVTDTYHVFRTLRAFRRYFREVAAVGSRCPASLRSLGALREVYALLHFEVWCRLRSLAE